MNYRWKLAARATQGKEQAVRYCLGRVEALGIFRLDKPGLSRYITSKKGNSNFQKKERKRVFERARTDGSHEGDKRTMTEEREGLYDR